MKALILTGVVVQISEDSFPIAPPLFWVDCDETVTTGMLYDYDTKKFSEAPTSEITMPTFQ